MNNLYPHQEGIWTLTAPDGRTWQAESGLHCAAKESNERIPAHVQLARIFDAIKPTPDELRIEALEREIETLKSALAACEAKCAQHAAAIEVWQREAQSAQEEVDYLKRRV